LPEAQYNLANMLAQGEGVGVATAADHEGRVEQAIELFKKAAEQGIVEAQHNLGVIFEHGEGTVPPDMEQARAWYRKASLNGLKEAQEALDRIGAAKVVMEAKDRMQRMVWVAFFTVVGPIILVVVAVGKKKWEDFDF
jgi:TPR repeat protein